jgi:hypothetical protein
MPNSSNRTSQSKKHPKPKGISVSHPNSRTQRALAAERLRKTKKASALEREAIFFETHYPKLNITEFGTRNAKQYAKYRESVKQRNNSKLNSLKAKLKGNLANMAQHVNRLNEFSKLKLFVSNVDKRVDKPLERFIKLYSIIRKRHGDITNTQLERLMLNMLSDTNNNDILLHKSIKNLINIYNEVRQEHGDVIGDELEELMWIKMIDNYNNK